MSANVLARLAVRRVRATRYGSRIGLGAMLAGVFVAVRDNSIVNVAISNIRTTLGANGPGVTGASGAGLWQAVQ
jgi:hypothetical protein